MHLARCPDMKLLEERLQHWVQLWVSETSCSNSALVCCLAGLGSLFPTGGPWQGSQGGCKLSAPSEGRSVKTSVRLYSPAGLPSPLPHMGLLEDLQTDSAAREQVSQHHLDEAGSLPGTSNWHPQRHPPAL